MVTADRPIRLSNAEVAAHIRETAQRLQRAGESPYRVAAFRRAAATFARYPGDLHQLLAEQGENGLRSLPGVGRSLARAASELLRAGRLRRLERLRRRTQGPDLLRTLPGVGPRLAQRVAEHLGATSLEEIFAAACDGRLRRVPGLGPKRLRAIRESLATRLQATDLSPKGPVENEPPIADLLSIDAEYRRKAAEHRLPRATPKFFNPTGEAWLPVLQTRRGHRAYTAHFANTARSHRLGRFRDWVVITCDTKSEYAHWTVITSHWGDLRGQRLVMHREQECRAYYRALKTQQALALHDAQPN